MGKQLESSVVTAVHAVSLVYGYMRETALPPNIGHPPAVLIIIIEEFGQLTHAPTAKMLE